MSTKKRLRIGTLLHAPPLPPPFLACTRFNNKTWQEYQTWKSANQQTYEQIYQRPLKCIYGSPREISNIKIPPQARILVIEMNNDENKIQGIGIIRNETASEVYRPSSRPTSTPGRNNASIKYNHIFSDRNYTRYIYIGNTYYATREELLRNHTDDAQYINILLNCQIPPTATTATTAVSSPPQTPQESIIHYIERLLFKGARHMKRGSGINRITIPPHQSNQ
jgi:hypothetical protein